MKYSLNFRGGTQPLTERQRDLGNVITSGRRTGTLDLFSVDLLYLKGGQRR